MEEIKPRKSVGLAVKLAAVWNKLEKKATITSHWMVRELDYKYQQQEVSSVLGKYVKRGYAVRGRIGFFIKLRDYKPQVLKPIRKAVAQPMDAVTIGRSILELIESLKKQIATLRQHLIEERQIVKQVVEQKRDLEILLAKAQSRILELNKNGV